MAGHSAGHGGNAGSCGFDPSKPSAARVYDYLLGGKDNFAADREAAARLVEALPDAARVAKANRAFLAAAVRYVAARGVPPGIVPITEWPLEKADAAQSPPLRLVPPPTTAGMLAGIGRKRA